MNFPNDLIIQDAEQEASLDQYAAQRLERQSNKQGNDSSPWWVARLPWLVLAARS